MIGLASVAVFGTERNRIRADRARLDHQRAFARLAVRVVDRVFAAAVPAGLRR